MRPGYRWSSPGQATSARLWTATSSTATRCGLPMDASSRSTSTCITRPTIPRISSLLSVSLGPDDVMRLLGSSLCAPSIVSQVFFSFVGAQHQRPRITPAQYGPALDRLQRTSLRLTDLLSAHFKPTRLPRQTILLVVIGTYTQMAPIILFVGIRIDPGFQGKADRTSGSMARQVSCWVCRDTQPKDVLHWPTYEV